MSSQPFVTVNATAEATALDQVLATLQGEDSLTPPPDLLRPLQNASTPEEFATTGGHILTWLVDRGTALDLRASVLWDYLRPKIWRPDEATPPATPSQNEYLASLGPDVVEAVRRGTSTLQAQRSAINTIEKHWGPDWFGKIPAEMLLSPGTTSPHFLTKRLLQRIAAVAKTDTPLLSAIDGCQTAMARRTDESARRADKNRAPRTRALLVQDVDVFLHALQARQSSPARSQGKRKAAAESEPEAEPLAANAGEDEGEGEGQGEGEGEEGEECEAEGDANGEDAGQALTENAGTGERGLLAGSRPVWKRRRLIKFQEQTLYQSLPLSAADVDSWVKVLQPDGEEGGSSCLGPDLARTLHRVGTHFWDNVDTIIKAASKPDVGRSLCQACAPAFRPIWREQAQRLRTCNRATHPAGRSIPARRWRPAVEQSMPWVDLDEADEGLDELVNEVDLTEDEADEGEASEDEADKGEASEDEADKDEADREELVEEELDEDEPRRGGRRVTRRPRG